MSESSIPLHLQEGDQAGSDEHKQADTDDVMEIGHLRSSSGFKFTDYVSTGKGLKSFARVTEDGRIVINLDLRQKLPDLPESFARDVKEFGIETDPETFRRPPHLHILILIVGSRGDVQPYLALGQSLLSQGHSVRIGTHETFREFVKDAGLGFYPIGGNPQELMSYMVKNPGLLPGIDSLLNGDIKRKRVMLGEIMDGCWKAATQPDELTGEAFVPDAIISNPPNFAHIHIAERWGIPLQLSFTMPWSPTRSFPHPLVNIGQSNAEKGLTNYLTYGLTDLLTWQGIGDLVNEFRTKTLKLSALNLRTGPGILDRVKVPWTYCLSPTLIPKPSDWRNHLDVVGFYFMNASTNFKPPEDLAQFLSGGEPPVYIGFGSVVVEDSRKMTDTIFSAIEKAGVRALVSAGWGGLGGVSVPSNVFMVGNVPHDWLFDKVSAVVHHGGAGTTAIGLRLGRPTAIVPFFGDQPFWGAMVANAGAGPDPIPQKQLNADNLSAAIKFCLTPDAQRAAAEMGKQIKAEDGVAAGVESFYKHLPLLNMRCDVDPQRCAVWYHDDEYLRLSSYAAQILLEAKVIDVKKLSLHRSKEYETRAISTDPITGGVVEILRTVTHYNMGIAQIFYNPVQGIINTTVAIPKGIAEMIGSVHEGFVNFPKLYGTEVRESGKIENFSDGLREGGKGLFYGYYDGIKGLVTEPIKGAKSEGFLGAIKGSARSFANVSMFPAAGALGLVVSPAKGAWRSFSRRDEVEQDRDRRESRTREGERAVKGVSDYDKKKVLGIYKGLVTKEARQGRIERLKTLATEAVQNNVAIEAQVAEAQGHASQQQSADTKEEGKKVVSQPDPPAATSAVDGEASASTSDEAFERDLERAKQLSLTDQ